MVNKYYVSKPKPELSPSAVSRLINEIILQELDEQCPQLSSFSSKIKRGLISHISNLYKDAIEDQYKRSLEKFHVDESSPIERAAKQILNGSLHEEVEKYLKQFESATPGLINKVLSNSTSAKSNDSLFADLDSSVVQVQLQNTLGDNSLKENGDTYTEKNRALVAKNRSLSKMYIYEEDTSDELTQAMYLDCLSKARDIMQLIPWSSEGKEFNRLSRLLAKYLATKSKQYLDDFNAISRIKLTTEAILPFVKQFEAEEADRLIRKKARDLAEEEERREAEKKKDKKEWFLNSSPWTNI